MLCLYIEPREIVWSDVSTSVLIPIHMATPRPAMYGRYHVYPPGGCGCGISMQLIPHLVGQLLLLFA